MCPYQKISISALALSPLWLSPLIKCTMCYRTYRVHTIAGTFGQLMQFHPIFSAASDCFLCGVSDTFSLHMCRQCTIAVVFAPCLFPCHYLFLCSMMIALSTQQSHTPNNIYRTMHTATARVVRQLVCACGVFVLIPVVIFSSPGATMFEKKERHGLLWDCTTSTHRSTYRTAWLEYVAQSGKVQHCQEASRTWPLRWSGTRSLHPR